MDPGDSSPSLNQLQGRLWASAVRFWVGPRARFAGRLLCPLRVDVPASGVNSVIDRARPLQIGFASGLHSKLKLLVGFRKPYALSLHRCGRHCKNF